MPETKTYRGRTLEEVLPKIREELGPDALVLKRREGLAGGVGGFFQHPFVEVEARAPVAEPEVEVRTDRATAEGLATPAMQALLESASPFAARLAEAARGDTVGLYGPQPSVEDFIAADVWEAPEPAGEVELPVLEPREVDSAPVVEAPAPAALAAPPVAAEAPPAAAALRASLEGAGLTAAFAAEVVDEAVVHGVPFASPRSLKTLVRAAVARRIPVMAPIGPGLRVVAVVGGSGAGKSTAAGRLAAAYRTAGAVPVRELTPDDPQLRQPFDGLTVVDAPATGV